MRRDSSPERQGAGDNPVGGLLIGLTCVYAADMVASRKPDLPLEYTLPV